MTKRILTGVAFSIVVATPALSLQSSPERILGHVPRPAQWNAAFVNKRHYFRPLGVAGTSALGYALNSVNPRDPLTNPAFSGSPTAPTPAVTNSGSSLLKRTYAHANTGCEAARKWGFVGDGVTDNLTAWSNWNSATTGNACLHFTSGSYKFSTSISKTINGSITFEGDGPGTTQLLWPNASGGISLQWITCNNSIHIHNIDFVTGEANGGTGLSVTSPSSGCVDVSFQHSDIVNSRFLGADGGFAADYWSVGVQINGVYAVNFDTFVFFGGKGSLIPSSVNIHAGLGNGIVINGNGSQYGVLYNIDKSYFHQAAHGIIYGSYVQGVNVNLCNFNGGSVGIMVPSGASGVLAQLYVTNSQFNTGLDQIDLLTTIAQFSAINNTFFIGKGRIGINYPYSATGTQPVVIAGNDFDGQGKTDGSYGYYQGANTYITGGSIRGNNFWNIQNAIIIATTNAIISDNSFTYNVGTPIINRGTGNVIHDNPGYNAVGVSSATYSEASDKTYSAGASLETHYLTGGSVTAVKVPASGTYYMLIYTVHCDPWTK